MKILEIILLLVLAVFSAITASKWEKLTKIKKAFVVVAIFAAFVIAWNAFQNWRKERLVENINATFGNIKDLEGAIIPSLQIGENGATFILTNGVFNFTPFGQLIKLYVKDNRLFVTTIIRQRDAKIIAAIHENNWELVDNDYDYNNDKTALEVVTKGDHKVYFQVELKKGVAHISGLLFSENGNGVYFYNPPNTSGSYMTVITPNTDFVLPENFLSPIFKYPRGKYFGERNK